MAFLAKGRSRCNMQLEPGVLTNKAGQVCAETGNPVVRLLSGVRALFRKLEEPVEVLRWSCPQQRGPTRSDR